MSQPQDDDLGEVARREQEKLLELPDLGMFDDVGAPPPPYALPQDSDQSEPVDRRDRERRREQPIMVLEDVYASYPEIGRGEWKMRIFRTEPKTWKGSPIAGFITDVYERLSLDDFRSQFGGGVFSIMVMKPTAQNEATSSDFKAVKEIRFRVSGDPIAHGEQSSPRAREPKSDEGKMTQQIEIHRLQYEAQERERLHQERQRAEEKADRLQREVMPNIYETTKRVVEDSHRFTEAQVEFWKEEASRLKTEAFTLREQMQREAAEREQKSRSLSEEILELKHRATSTTLAAETKAIADLRATYDARISELKDQSTQQQREIRDRSDEERRRMQEEFSRKLAEISAEHRRIVEDMTRRHDEERRNYESAQTLERERLREDSRYRIDQTTAQKEQEVRQLRETFEQRIADLRTTTDRELQALRDLTAREIESVRQAERAQATLARESVEMRKEHMKAEETRLRQEIADLRRDAAELRERLEQERLRNHKDFPTALREAREMANQLGLVDPTELERPEAPESSTMSQVLGLARQAFDAAPQVLDKIMQARKEQGDAIVQAQRIQQAQAQQQLAMQQAQAMQSSPRQLPPPQAAQPRPAPSRYAPPGIPTAAPMPATAMGSVTPAANRTAAPFGAYAPPMSSPVPFGAPVAIASSPVQPQAAQQVQPPQEVAQSQAVAQESQEAPALPAEVSFAPEPPPAQESASGGADDPQLIIKFFEKLDGAVRNKVISPETFAIGVIGEIGPEKTASLLGMFKPEEIIETAQNLSEDTAIGTRDGQKYVRELWRVATIKVQEQGYSP